jgi:2-polyprenyl-6-methoxyphenol hydroxylase-like FAD-dependent oxidoreductase
MLQSVLVVGAGPTGLAMAAELARHGVQCRVIDKALAPSNKSKAIVIQARTLEQLSLMQLADEFVTAGHPVHAANIYSNGKRVVHLRFDDLDSPYPYLLVLAQSETERILGDRLRQLGVVVERGVELLSLSQDTEKATVELRHTDGHTEYERVDWVVGCDGPHSTVRRALDVPFEGHTFDQIFVLADVHVQSALSDSELYIHSQHGDICAIFPLGGGRYRVIADNPPGSLEGRDPTLDECQEMVNARMSEPVTLSDPEWTATFRVNSRMVKELRSRRVFLAGDAAHIHSPAGGQGMNTGIQDAVNLAWKLALVCSGRSDPSLLDSYQSERYPVERSVLRQTDVMFRLAGASGGIGAFVLQHVAPLIGSLDFVQHEAARRVSEIDIEYEHSPIVEDHHVPSGPRAGDRAPDAVARLAPDGATVHVVDVCSRPQHTLLVIVDAADHVALADDVSRKIDALYGDVITAVIVSDAVASRDEPSTSPATRVATRAARSLLDEYGSARPTMYLVRPDGYIGFRAPLTPSADELMQYLARLMPHKPAAATV